MGPSKKPKPDSQASAAVADAQDPPNTTTNTSASASTPSTSSTPAASEILQNSTTSASATDSVTSTSSATPPATPGAQTPKGKKWLSGTGSWRSKAPAIVKTATESIGVSVSGGASGELRSEDATKTRDDSPKKFLTKRKSSKGDAIPAAITQVNVSSDGQVDENQKIAPPTVSEPEEPPAVPSAEPPLPPDPPKMQAQAVANTWGWKSWWSRPDGYSDAQKIKEVAQDSVEEASSTPLPGATPSEEPNALALDLNSADSTASTAVGSSTASDAKRQDDTPVSEQTAGPDSQVTPATPQEAAKRNAPGGSWFWSWSKAQNAQGNPVTDANAQGTVPEATSTSQPPSKPASQTVPDESNPEPQSQPSDASAEFRAETPEDNSARGASSKASAWAFWYRDKPNLGKKAEENGAQKHVGEVAVMDTPSQSHPEAAQFNEQQEPQPEPAKQSDPSSQPAKQEPAPKKSFVPLRGRSKPKATPKETTTEAAKPSSAATPTQDPLALEPTRPETAPAPKPAPKQVAKAKQDPKNLILPEFNSTYQFVQQPTFWKQVRRYFLGGEPAAPHLHRNPAPPRIKKAVAIGVHGFFPAPIIQKVLGQPTGTSIRFANAAAAAIKDWSEARGYSPEIEQIALEGEGFIAERVNALWKLLLNWVDHLKAADFILVACHSQGVPVAMMLVAKLIQFGCVGATRIGVCAMAGVNMGPFIEYKTKYFGPTAAELFEFSDPKSLVSQMYLAALDEVLRYGVRILYVGSIDDQLVSLESSTFSTLSHPYIYRAVFVDGRIHAPDFLTHLVGFSLKLRNLGLPDHGLIRELSPALAGSLYGGEGHSSLYHDPAVYALAVQHALETTSLPIPPQQRPSTSGSFQGISIPVIGEKIEPKDKDLYKLRVKEYEPSTSSTNPNPFFLPWAMRGLLEEDFVKKELGKEVEDLLNMFEVWKPAGKQLKDVKFRLEAVRSKL